MGKHTKKTIVTRATTLRLPADLIMAGKFHALKTGLTLQEIVARALVEYLAAHKGERS